MTAASAKMVNKKLFNKNITEVSCINHHKTHMDCISVQRPLSLLFSKITLKGMQL